MADTTGLMPQKITKQVTLNAGETGSCSVAIPSNRTVFLRGYGYTWYTTTTYKLRTGFVGFPARTDQEGSQSIPSIFETPYACKAGDDVSVTITNGDSISHTYTVVFHLLTNELLNELSTGGELVIPAGSVGSGTTVSIYDSSFTTNAGVTTKGLQVEANAPATLRDGTVTTAGAAAVALASTVTLKKGVLIQLDPASTANGKVGNATSQSITLQPGDSIYLEIDDPAKVYVIRSTATNVTFNYNAS